MSLADQWHFILDLGEEFRWFQLLKSQIPETRMAYYRRLTKIRDLG
jgi:hypothetical protein